MNKTVFVFLWLTVIIFIFIGSNVFAAGFQSKQITAGHQLGWSLAMLRQNHYAQPLDSFRGAQRSPR